MTTQIRLYLELAAVAVLLIAFALFVHHERAVGAEKVHTADAKALQAARKQAYAETALNLERAAKADAGARSAQKAVDDYVAAQPIEPVRLCANNRIPVPAQGSAIVPAPQGAGPGSAPVREVQSGIAGPDIGPGFTELVLAAARVAVLYNDLQQR